MKTQSARASPVAPVVNNLPMQETWVRSLGREDPLEEGMDRSLPGYGPQGHKESDTTEPLSTQAHGVGVCTRLHHGPIVTADPASPLNEVM